VGIAYVIEYVAFEQNARPDAFRELLAMLKAMRPGAARSACSPSRSTSCR